MRHLAVLVLLVLSLSSCKKDNVSVKADHNLIFSELPKIWDEAIPLGNGMLGALVWQNNDMLRVSLDRVDLWDLRPMNNLDFSKFTYSWVYDQWKNDTYKNVQKQMDLPYDQRMAPTKIPAAALEFDISELGDPYKVALLVDKATCIIKWETGETLTIFINGSDDIGWYRFENCKKEIKPVLIAPAYEKPLEGGNNNIKFNTDLALLGYGAGEISTSENEIEYNQEGWGEFRYSVGVKWESSKNSTLGCWSISSSFPGWEESPSAKEMVSSALDIGFNTSLKSHLEWWKNYWDKSSVSIPDSIIEKQYYMEMYKFGSAARANTPPISLQAVWTADNGKLPPWKGDFHHDLNTQLSYWPSYAGNQTDLGEGFVNWLWKYKPVFEKYTKEYYGYEGLNVPGVTTLTGEPMGGWIQYSLGPTVSAWLAHHFYLQWRYTMDRDFLSERAWPWITATTKHLDNISVTGSDGFKKLPISSSPEIYDNSKEAWFGNTTNFDLALIRWTYEKAAELADELGYTDKAIIYREKLNEWPELAYDESGLLFAPGFPYEESHRHFSHLMGWHPFGLIDYSKGENDIEIIKNTLANLNKFGSDYWVGYSFSWQANLYARAFMGEEAANALKIFAEAFCLQNSFHVNGDQSGKGYSKFTYRPFTLEGNFAFASGLQDMLIQSHTGVVRIFPAIPESWKTLSFDKLRTEGAFLVSAYMEEGVVTKVRLESLAGGELKLYNPFKSTISSGGKSYNLTDKNIFEIEMQPGEVVILKAE